MQLYQAEPPATIPDKTTQQRLLSLTVLLLVALGVRLLGIELQPLWWDEGFSLYFATESTPRLLELTSLDIHPPLYYLLLQGWYQMVGVGALQSRWFSVLVGVLAIPLGWRVAHDLFGKRTAWLTALLLTISPFHIYYSQEVRMYGLMVVLTLAAVIAWRRRKWVALGLALLAGLLTQYYFALMAGAIGLLVLGELRQKRYGWQGPLLAAAVAVLGYLPWVVYALPRLITYVGGKLVVEADTPMTPLEFLPRHLAAWSMGHLSAPMSPLGWSALAFLGLIAFGWYQAKRQQRTGRLISTALLWLIPTFGILVVGLYAPFTDARIERQLLFVLPFFLMLVAVGLASLWQKSRFRARVVLAGIVVVSLMALSDFYTVPRYLGEDYRPLLADVDALQGPHDGWLAIYEWQIGYLRAYLPDAEPETITINLAWAEEPIALEQGINALLNQYPRLWLPAYQVKGRIFEEQVADTLASEGVTAWDDWYGNTRLYLFGQTSGEIVNGRPLGTYPQLEQVTGAIGVEKVASGIGIVPVFVSAEVPAESARLSLQVVGRGAVWGEWDGAVEEGAVKAGIPIIAGTPPGEYEVYATLYDGVTNAPYPRSEQGILQAPEALLGAITIERPLQPLLTKSVQRLATQVKSVEMGNTVRWVGVALPNQPLLQGDTLPVTLLWQSLQSVNREVRVFIQGFNKQGELKINHEIAPVNGTFPLPQWQLGDLIRDPHRVQLPPDLPAGNYQLVAGMYDSVTGQRLTTADGRDTLDLGIISVEERERLLQAPTIGEAVSHPFGERAELVQVSVKDFFVTDTPTHVTLLWQSTQTGGTPLRAFVQIYQGDTQIAVSDHLLDPPATAWIVGEYIMDSHLIPLPPDLPAGEYRIIAGLVDAQSNTPLSTLEGTPFVEIHQETIEN
jgi:4-amino-4-deoxy-L-arabinose transferase-like glycosyltransferase